MQFRRDPGSPLARIHSNQNKDSPLLSTSHMFDTVRYFPYIITVGTITNNIFIWWKRNGGSESFSNLPKSTLPGKGGAESQPWWICFHQPGSYHLTMWGTYRVGEDPKIRPACRRASHPVDGERALYPNSTNQCRIFKNMQKQGIFLPSWGWGKMGAEDQGFRDPYLWLSAGKI